MQTAKVFKSGDSTVIRLPKEFLIDDVKEFIVETVGKKIILTPKTKKRNMGAFFDELDKIGGVDLQRIDLPLQEREF